MDPESSKTLISMQFIVQYDRTYITGSGLLSWVGRKLDTRLWPCTYYVCTRTCLSFCSCFVVNKTEGMQLGEQSFFTPPREQRHCLFWITAEVFVIFFARNYSQLFSVVGGLQGAAVASLYAATICCCAQRKKISPLLTTRRGQEAIETRSGLKSLDRNKDIPHIFKLD